jgi:hypothetical protein
MEGASGYGGEAHNAASSHDRGYDRLEDHNATDNPRD